jgi:hypothetical protein
MRRPRRTVVDGKQKTRRRSRRSPAGRELVIIMVAIVLAGCTSTRTTAGATFAATPGADAPTTTSATTDHPTRTPSFAEDASKGFHARWCVDAHRFVQTMRISPREQASAHFEELAGSGKQFGELGSHLYARGFPLTAGAASRVSRTIRAFINAVTPPRPPMPPTQAWDSLLEYAREMREPALAANTVGRLVSSLGAC